MAEQSADIVRRAEQLALSLTSGPTPVKRNILLGITSDFLNDPKPDQGRLRRTVDLIAKGSGGHLKRGGGYGEQVRTAAIEVARVLDENLTDPELKSLLGWTARLLLVRRVPADQQPGGTTAADPGGPKEKELLGTPKPVQKNPVLSNILLKLDRGTVTAFRSNKAVATCRPEDLDIEVRDILKKNPKGVRADVEVVKDSARILGVPKLEIAK
ncbi:MAG TPA: hypothetical protein VF179_20965 [Thermoanaerobaculia bacterium]|nr:hypothetical protein [Thermoanaerobaculia bacterium]